MYDLVALITSLLCAGYLARNLGESEFFQQYFGQSSISLPPQSIVRHAQTYRSVTETNENDRKLVYRSSSLQRPRRRSVS